MKAEKYSYEYGRFFSGDPRDFEPDPEECTEEEIANWKRMCEIYNKAEQDGKPLEPIKRKPFGFSSWVPECGSLGVGTQKYKNY